MATESEVLNLLGLFANPKTAAEAQDRIAAYNAKVAENEKVLAQVEETRTEAAKFRADGQDALRAAQAKLNEAKTIRAQAQEFKDKAEIRSAECDARKEQLAKDEIKLSELNSTLNTLKRALEEREADLALKEKDFANRKAALEKKFEAMQRIVND